MMSGMIFLCYCLLFLLLWLISKVKFHKWFNIVSLFNSIWLGFGAVSIFGIDHLRKPDLIIHLWTWLFVIVVNFVFFIFEYVPNNKNKYIFMTSSMDPNSKNIGLIFIQISAIVLGINQISKSLHVLMEFKSLEQVRNSYFFYTSFGSPLLGILFRTIPMAFFEALIFYYIFIAFENKKYKYIFYSFLNVIVITVINGGRYAIINMFYCMLIMYIIQPKGFIGVNKISKKMKRRLQFTSVILIGIMISTTILRGQNIFLNIISYFSGSFSFLDYIIDNPQTFGFGSPMNGYFTFSIILEPLVMLLKVLGISNAKIPSYYFNIYCQDFYNIGTDGHVRMYNNNTTVLYYFLRDYGTIGIIIGGIFIGGMVVFFYNSWKKNNKEIYGVLFIYMATVLLNSIMTYQICSYTPFFIIVAFYICTKVKKKNKIHRID